MTVRNELIAILASLQDLKYFEFISDWTFVRINNSDSEVITWCYETIGNLHSLTNDGGTWYIMHDGEWTRVLSYLDEAYYGFKNTNDALRFKLVWG